MIPKCKNNHPLTKDNTYIEKRKLKGGNISHHTKCVTCRRESRKKLTEDFHKVDKRQPTGKELMDAVYKEISWAELGRRCGMSDVACRKQAKQLGLLD